MYLAAGIALAVVLYFSLYSYSETKLRASALAQAQQASEKRNYDLALRHLNKYLAEKPNDVEALEAKTKIVTDLANSWETLLEAAQLNDQLIRLDPNGKGRDETRRRLAQLYIDYSDLIRHQAELANSSDNVEKKESRYRAAITILNQLIATNPQDEVAQRLLGSAYMGLIPNGAVVEKSEVDLKLIDDATTHLKAALKLDPGDLKASERLATLYLNILKNPVSGQAVLDSMLKVAADSLEARMARYRVFESSKRTKEAKDELDAAIKIAPDNVPLRILAARLAFYRRDSQEARQQLDAIPASAQDDLMIRMLRGNLEFAEQHPEEAIDEWRKGLSLVSGNNQMLTWQLAYTLIRSGRLTEAAPLVDRYLQMAKPRDTMGLFLQGVFDQASGHLNEAIKKLERVNNLVDLSKKFEVLMALGRCYETIGEGAKALSSYKSAATVSGTAASPRQAIARYYSQSNQTDEAIAELERALSALPDELGIIVDLIQLKFAKLNRLPAKQRSWTEIGDLIARAKKLSPSSSMVQILEANYLANSVGIDRALELLSTSARGPGRLRPESWRAWAEALERQNRREEAIHVIDEGMATDAAGDRASLRISKARLLLRIGKGQEAREVLTKNIEASPRSERPELYHELGDLLRNLGDREAARAAFLEWARLVPESPTPAVALLNVASLDNDDEAAKLGIELLHHLGRENLPYALVAQATELLRTDPSQPGPPTAERLEKAERLVAELSLVAPDLTLKWFLMGQIQEFRADVSNEKFYRDSLIKASESYNKVFKAAPISNVLPRLIEVYMKLKDYGKLQEMKARFDELAATQNPNAAVDFARISAAVALKLGDKKRAEDYVSTIVQGRPENAQIRVAQAELLDSDGKPAEAEAIYEDLCKTRPELPVSWFSLIRQQAKRKAPVEVARTIDQARRKYTGDRPDLFIARCLVIGNDLKGAGRLFQEALDKKPDDLDTLRSVVQYRDSAGQSDQVEPLLRKIVKLFPKETWAAHALALRITSRPDPAAWQEAWTLVSPPSGTPDTPEDRLIRATILARSPESSKRTEAISAFASLANDLPITNRYGVEARVRLSQTMLELNRPKEAWAYITPLADEVARPGPLVLKIAIEALARSGNGAEAERRLNRLALLTPKATQVLLSKAWVLHAQQKDAEASAAIRTAFDDAEKTPEGETVGADCVDLLLRFNDKDNALVIAKKIAARWPKDAGSLARVHLVRREYDQALDACRIALDSGSAKEALRYATALSVARRQDPAFLKKIETLAEEARSKTPEDSQILVSLATLRHMQDRYEEEIAFYRAAMSLNPTNAQFVNNMAWTLSEGLNKPEEALRLVEDVIRREGPAAQFLDTRGVILGRLGQLDKAIADLELSVKADQAALTYYHLARVYRKANRPDDWKRCRDLARARGFEVQGLDLTDRAELDEVMGKD